ncbi:bifunctional nuclease family protein [Aquihabitans sp. G128]|uniref:bifunctional nuclease family protein n=1 Tax=Aquihabitans sp. G128 TaxID=2849779 RepID=UPI0020B1C5EE|nr:bifunctional nuclease family protein [Aquihabitans sp. G128]
MELVGVRVEMPSSSPIALLREVGGARRVLPIFIGAPEATAIAFALEEVVTPRPMTHDLFREVLDDLGVSLEKITVTELKEGVFHAELELNGRDGVHTISSRPSDAIALAARTGSPIYANEDVLAEAGYLEDDEPEEEAQQEEVVEEFRSFIDSVNPEDFA